MNERTVLPLLMILIAAGCGADDEGGGFAGPPPFGGGTPNTTEGDPAPLQPADSGQPGDTNPSIETDVSAQSQSPSEEAPNPGDVSGPASTDPVDSGEPSMEPPPAEEPGMQPLATEGASMVDVVIQAQEFNVAPTNDNAFGPGGVNIDSFNVGSVTCFDDVDLTGVQSIDVTYSRDDRTVSSAGRFALLWGSADITEAENLGERFTGHTGGWDQFETLNVGLARAVDEVGLLCLRGVGGNGILVLDHLTLRAAPGVNDGVTNFNPPPPQGPPVEPVRVVGSEVQFGGPGTSVAGNSFFWSNGTYGQDIFYTAETVQWLVQDWGAQIVRAAMAVDDGARPLNELRGYLTEPFDNQFSVRKVVDAAIENGIYVIIDYHAHAAERNTPAAVDFFGEMASLYGDYDNVIYEVYNEPVNTSWPQIKQYAEPVIAAIRAQDPDNLIVVGTPFYSQQVGAAAADPIDDDNVAYTLHFYAGTHGEFLRNEARQAMNNGIALMATEWGSTGADGQGQPNQAATQQWMDFLRENNISHCNWAVADQGEGTASGLVRGASPLGGWSDADLTSAGLLTRSIVQGW